jgi:hypothetical protein
LNESESLAFRTDVAEYFSDEGKFTASCVPFGTGFVRESEKVISPSKLADSYDFAVPSSSLRIVATNTIEGLLVKIPCMRIAPSGQFDFVPETRLLK